MNSSELRARARVSLTGNYWYAVLAAFIVGIFGAGIANSGSFSVNIDMETANTVFGEIPAGIIVLLAALGLGASTLSLVHFILGGVIQLGYAQYLLKQHDGEIHTTKDLFSQFDRFGPGSLQLFLRNLFTILWSLLLVIPGIIKSISYAMTPYIMAENPEMTAREAINESKRLMYGHKWELFCLELSFIGWYLLAALTVGIGGFFLAPYVEAAPISF